MAKKFEFNVEARALTGSGNTRRLLRVEDKVPAIVYGGGKDPEKVCIPHQAVSLALENEAVFSHILTLHMNDKSEKVILKDLQRHPWKPRILHIDFQRISETEKLTMHVPIHYLNEASSPGVKAGGIVSHHINEVEIRCLPANLPEFIEVDVEGLELDNSLHLSDIRLPKDVELAIAKLDEAHNQPIVSIHLPRAAKEEEAAVKVEEGAAATEAPAAETKGEEKKSK